MALLTQDVFLAQLTPDSIGVSEQQCPICLDNATNITKTVCQHRFCFNCLRRWLLEDAHTCPSCRRALYDPSGWHDNDEEMFGDETEDVQEEEVEEQMPDFGFEYHVGLAQQMGVYLEDSGVMDMEPTCAMCFRIAYVDYDNLLLVAITRITRRMQRLCPERCPTPSVAEAYRDGLKCVVTAVKTVLGRHRGTKLAGLELFQEMDHEVQQQLRAPANAGIRDNIIQGNIWPLFDVCVAGVLHRIVESGFAANNELQPSPQYPVPDRLVHYGKNPFCVHPQDLLAAITRIESLPGRNEQHADLFAIRLYISPNMLLPLYLASSDTLQDILKWKILDANITGLIEIYDYAWPLFHMATTIRLRLLHGETMTGLQLVQSLGFTWRTCVFEPANWPMHLTQTANSVENYVRVVGLVTDHLAMLLRPVVAAAKEYYDGLSARRSASTSTSTSAPAVSEQ